MSAKPLPCQLGLQYRTQRANGVAQLLLCRFFDVFTNIVQVLLCRDHRVITARGDPVVLLADQSLFDNRRGIADPDDIHLYSRLRILVEHPIQKLFQLLIPVVRYGRLLCSHDVEQLDRIVHVPGQFASHHAVQHDPECPDIDSLAMKFGNGCCPSDTDYRDTVSDD